jgi:hypothetical protein
LLKARAERVPPLSLAATQADTVDALLSRSGRDELTLRSSFVSSPGATGQPGPLAAFVRHRREIALDLFLLGRVVASPAPFEAALSSSVWARALGLSSGPGAAATISKSWSWLEGQGLVETVRRGRLRGIRFLDEGGTGRPAGDPAAERELSRCFRLPYVYWRANYPARLGLPAKTLLLISLSIGEPFAPPRDRDARWRGLSPDTVLRGLNTLTRLGILEFSPWTQTSPLSPRGYTIERRYALRPPFGSAPSDQPAGVAASRRRQRQAGQPSAVARGSGRAA